MNVWGHNLQVVSALFYILAFAAGMSGLCCCRKGKRGDIGNAHRRVAIFTLAAFLLQTSGLLLEGIFMHKCPLGSMADVLEIVAWSLVVIYGIVGTAYRMSLLGLFTSAMAAVFSIAAIFSGTDRMFPDISATILVHAWLSLFSFGAFGIMALVSTMYLIQLHGLKKRKLAPLFDLLPSLRELERVNFRLLVASAVVYTAAIVVGAWWYFSSGGNISEAKLLMALIVWAGYTLALCFKLSGTLHGRRFAYTLIAIFILAIVTLVPLGIGHTQNPPSQPTKEVVR
jgi:HemX protein